MAKLDDLLAELNELDKVESGIINRVWNESGEAKDLSGAVLSQENIKRRVKQLALEIVADYPEGNPVIVGLMDGAVPFASLLSEALQELNYPFNYTTMSVSSYGNQMASGALKMGALPKVSLIGQPVIVIDDVCDTGKTLKAVRDAIQKQHPKSLKLMTLVDKVQERPEGCDPHYVGFRLPHDAFIIGMGLDYRRGLRDKTSIRVADLKSLPNDDEKGLLKRKEEVLKQIREIIAQEEEQATKFVSPVPNSIFNTNSPRNTEAVDVAKRTEEAKNPFEFS